VATIAAVVLVIQVRLGDWHSYETAIFSRDQPGPVRFHAFGFPAGLHVLHHRQEPRAAKERLAYADQWVCAQTGFGADGAVMTVAGRWQISGLLMPSPP
jgi:cation/acetate symporter